MGVKDCRMLNLCGDDVSTCPAPREEDVLQRVIVGFAGTAGEYHLVRATAKQPGHLTRLFDCLARCVPGPVAIRKLGGFNALHLWVEHTNCSINIAAIAR